MAAVRQWRNYLPNTVRAGIRGAIERLPAPVQGLFPAPDLRRQIRAAPERRDTLDPEWRIRVGAPHAPADIASRRQYIELEKALSRAGNQSASQRVRERKENQRAQLAAALYDSVFEGQDVYTQLYTGYEDVNDRNEVRENLIHAMTGRMSAAMEHTDLTPLFPENLHFEPDPEGEALEMYGIRGALGILDAWEGRPLPFGVPPALFPLVGRIHPVEEHFNFQPAPVVPINDAIYNDLPNLGAVRVPEEDPILFDTFDADEPLLIVQEGTRSFYYKRRSLQGWLNMRIQNREPLTNPATGLVITMDNLRRGTALVGNAGGRRRARRTRRRKRRSTTRRSGRRAHR